MRTFPSARTWRKHHNGLSGGWAIWCLLGIVALAAFGWQYFGGARTPLGLYHVIDGDTLGFLDGRPNARLVGFNTPEAAQAQCESERKLGERAKARLRKLISSGTPTLEYVRCSCRAGTEGTQACNYGRACARLRIDGRDVAGTMIAEGLAEPYNCGPTGCPRRRAWC